MFFSLCLTLYFPRSLLPFTHTASIHFQYYFCFLPGSSPAAVLVSQNKFHFHFLPFLLTFCFLFIVNCLFFHFTVPPDLPSLPISLALGLLNCAFYLYAALQYSGGRNLFSSYVHFRDRTVPPTISIHLHPPFLAPMTVFN